MRRVGGTGGRRGGYWRNCQGIVHSSTVLVPVGGRDIMQKQYSRLLWRHMLILLSRMQLKMYCLGIVQYLLITGSLIGYQLCCSSPIVSFFKFKHPKIYPVVSKYNPKTIPLQPHSRLQITMCLHSNRKYRFWITVHQYGISADDWINPTSARPSQSSNDTRYSSRSNTTRFYSI